MLVLLVATLYKSGIAERLYQTEGLPYDMSIEQFCLKQGVPVNEFNKLYRDTHKRIHPIQVDGIPSEEAKEASVDSPIKETNPVRIAVTICMSNGFFITDNGRFGEEQIYRILDSAEGGTRPDDS